MMNKLEEMPMPSPNKTQEISNNLPNYQKKSASVGTQASQGNGPHAKSICLQTHVNSLFTTPYKQHMFTRDNATVAFYKLNNRLVGLII